MVFEIRDWKCFVGEIGLGILRLKDYDIGHV